MGLPKRNIPQMEERRKFWRKSPGRLWNRAIPRDNDKGSDLTLGPFGRGRERSCEPEQGRGICHPPEPHSSVARRTEQQGRVRSWRKGVWAGCEGSVPRAVSLTLTEVGPEGSVFAGKEKTWELSFDPSEPSEVTEL
jgi:hypothetical protein